MSTYYTNMSSLKNSLGMYEEALEFAEKSIVLYGELDDLVGVAVGYGNMGTTHYNLRNNQASLENHLKSVELHEELNNLDGMAHSLSNVAGLYGLMADTLAQTESRKRQYMSQAVDYGLRAYSLATELDALYVRNYAASTLMNAYRALGDPRKSPEYAEIVISTGDSLFNEEQTRIIEEMDTKYETEKKQQQIELQETQILARDAKIQEQKTLRNALIAGLSGVVLIILVVIWAYVQKRRDNQKIREQNVQISEANDELIEFKADRMPLGYYQGKDRGFTNHDIKLEIGDAFYIFSDGFVDQKGGRSLKKFMSRKFKNLLMEIHDQPLYDQKKILEKTLDDWMGDQSQIDDILVVGVRT